MESLIGMQNPKSILIIGFGGKGVGDQVIATPFIRNLAVNFPKAAIDFAASSQVGVELLQYDPCLSDSYVLNMDCFRFGGRLAILKKNSYLLWIRRKGYDRVYVLSTKLRHALVAFLSGAPERIGFASYHREFLLTRYWDEPVSKNLVDRFLDLLQLDGLTVKNNTVEIHLLEDEIAESGQMLKKLNPDSKPVVAIAPFSADMRRTWGLPAFSALISHCLSEGYFVVVIGSPSDCHLMDTSRFPMSNLVANLVGILSIRQSAAIIKNAAAFVGNDSGLAHVAGAVGTKGIVIGYHVTKVWYPSAPCIRTIIKVPGCTSCDLTACVGNTLNIPPCFQAVSVSDVMRELKSVM
ncbi:MAG: glycosyltransferase family 9 protein [Desulfuromonadaceae bacterium]